MMNAIRLFLAGKAIREELRQVDLIRKHRDRVIEDRNKLIEDQRPMAEASIRNAQDASDARRELQNCRRELEALRLLKTQTGVELKRDFKAIVDAVKRMEARGWIPQ